MLRVLTYHRVAVPEATPALDPALVSATPADFAAHVRHLADRYRPVSLAEVADAFASGRPLPHRAVLVTFDDGYRDFAEVAWPILRRHGVPATLFVPTGYPGHPERAFWWDRVHRALSHPRPAGSPVWAVAPDVPLEGPEGVRNARTYLRSQPPDRVVKLVDRICRENRANGTPSDGPTLLDWNELRQLAADGVDLAAHTRNHVPLDRVAPARARAEIRGSLDDLEREIGEVLPALAYPYGSHDDTVVGIAREEGCRLAFTCDDGLSEPGRTDPLRLCRTNITRKTTRRLFPLRMMPWFAAVDRWRHRHERAGRYV